VTVVAIKFHTREVNRRLFKIPMRAYTRRSISAFSEITIRGYHAQITQIASRFVEASNIFYTFSERIAAQPELRNSEKDSFFRPETRSM